MAPPSAGSEPADEADAVAVRLQGRFLNFSDECATFSKEVGGAAGLVVPLGAEDALLQNLFIARVVFSKWTLDILTVLYPTEWLGFQAIKSVLGRISGRVLSARLKDMERLGLVRRTVVASRPPRVQYALTDKGRTVARLEEPVFLYLRLMEGFLLRRATIPEEDDGHADADGSARVEPDSGT
ncbi:MAG TPA: helix-turn-helix domain-containing protein [Thermoplasmata archaeon]|nr:helix-turn-helix domain-containing protein [Thermoplasmata archaeon]